MERFLVGISSAIAGEIVKYTVAPIGRQCGYLVHYKRNMDKLNERIIDLERKRGEIKLGVEETRRRGDETKEDVKTWLSDSEKRLAEAKDILEHPLHHDKTNCFVDTLTLRHRVSRDAKKMARTIVCDIAKIDSFKDVSYRPILPSSFTNNDFQEFGTRIRTTTQILELLKRPYGRRIGVYGMGGVGKTTLVKEVARKAQEEELFTEVIMVTVSQFFDIKGIQNEIAEKLGLKLSEESMSNRANRLQHRLEDEKKLLIILDDIWQKIDLVAAGIYCDQPGCKILLVSRDQYTLRNLMDVDECVFVEVLSNHEAMTLFSKSVGEIIENSDFNRLAILIVGECGGLPIAVATIASTLKNRVVFVWEDVLNKLKRSPKEGYGAAYSSIKTSYDFIESNQDKAILLLCSLHEEDTSITMENLTIIHGASSDMLQEAETLDEVRNSIYTSVDRLKANCLLMDGDYPGTVKMHDVVRDIVMSIALEENHMQCFSNFAKLRLYLDKDKLQDTMAISLLGHNFHRLPNDLACPRLKLLLMLGKKNSQIVLPGHQGMIVPEECFNNAKELRAFCVWNSIVLESLPSSFPSLENLQALSLCGSKIEDIALIGELRNLIILDLSNSKFPQLPEEIGKLTCLRQLNLNGCTDLNVIKPNVISSLVQLEELYMDCVYIEWETYDFNGDRRNANLLEIKNLPMLRILHLYIADSSILPENMFTKKLEKYNIVVGSHMLSAPATTSRLLNLKLHKSSLLRQYGFSQLMKKSEVFHLVGKLTGFEDLNGFSVLKKLKIKDNDDVRCLGGTRKIQPSNAFRNLETLSLKNLRNLESISNENFTTTLHEFDHLKSVHVVKCDKLKDILPVSISRNVQEISVTSCQLAESIVYGGSNNRTLNDHKIEFPELRFLTLESLPNLSGFFSTKSETMHFSSSSGSHKPLFNNKVIFPSLKVLELSKMDFSELWPNRIPTASVMKNVTWLIVQNCHKLKYLLSIASSGNLTQLAMLEVNNCGAMEEVIVTQEGRLQIIMFPQLRRLTLKKLKSLKRFSSGDWNIKCESLVELRIEDCPALETFVGNSTATVSKHPLFTDKVSFPCLQRLVVYSCKSLKYLLSYAMARDLVLLHSIELQSCMFMEEVIIVDNKSDKGKLEPISFYELHYLELSHLPNLKLFCSVDCIQFPSLLRVVLRDHPDLVVELGENSTEDGESDYPKKFPLKKLMLLKNLKSLCPNQAYKLNMTSADNREDHYFNDNERIQEPR